jgi:hypothetical protein
VRFRSIRCTRQRGAGRASKGTDQDQLSGR